MTTIRPITSGDRTVGFFRRKQQVGFILFAALTRLPHSNPKEGEGSTILLF